MATSRLKGTWAVTACRLCIVALVTVSQRCTSGIVKLGSDSNFAGDFFFMTGLGTKMESDPKFTAVVAFDAATLRFAPRANGVAAGAGSPGNDVELASEAPGEPASAAASTTPAPEAKGIKSTAAKTTARRTFKGCFIACSK